MTDKFMRATPWGIGKMLGINLYPWQQNVLVDLMARKPTALCANNESGKTTRVAALAVLWFFLRYPRGKCVMTSGSWTQIETQLFPALLKHAAAFEGWTFNKTDFRTRKGGLCVAFSTREPGRFEGHHADGPECPLMVVVDEGKTVDDGIMLAIERCKPTYLLVMSSAGIQDGFFYRAFTTDAAFWSPHIITYKDCPHIKEEEAQKLIKKYKIDNPLVRSMLFSEFTDSANGMQTMIPLSVWNAALRTKPLRTFGESVVFMDFAAGGDENVAFSRHGNLMKMADAWREKNTAAAVGRFVMILNRLKREIGLLPGSIFGDAGGLGKPMCDSIGQAGWEVHGINNNSTAEDDNFADIASEKWFKTKQLLEQGKLLVEDDDPILRGQITARRFGLTLKGKIKLEPKDNLSESPDRADAFVGAATCNPIRPFNYLEKETPWGNEPDLEEETPAGQIPGAYAGL
jgi:phage terminase large subunit